MKKLLAMLALLPTLNCQPTISTPDASVGELPMRGGPPQMMSADSYESVAWVCRQADYNENLVWIECKFENHYTAVKRECIRVIISDTSGQEVDHTRIICSGYMQPGASYENYGSFTNSKHSHQRTDLQKKCGFDTGLCRMSTKRELADY